MIFYACAEPECELRGDDFSGVELKSKMGLTKSEATPFPTWARMGAGVPTGIPANDNYGVICFYVDPYDIPEFEYVNVPPTFTGDEPHNLLNWYDPRALWLPIEFTVEGTAWNQPGNPAPHHMHLDGKGAVPIWILTRQQVTDVTFDGIVTIAELDALPDPGPSKALQVFLTRWLGFLVVELLLMDYNLLLRENLKMEEDLISIITRNLCLGNLLNIELY